MNGLRMRTGNNRTLIEKTVDLNDRDFLIRNLYKYSYWLVFLSSIAVVYCLAFYCSFMFLLFYSLPIHVIKLRMSTYNGRWWWWWWWWKSQSQLPNVTLKNNQTLTDRRTSAVLSCRSARRARNVSVYECLLDCWLPMCVCVCVSLLLCCCVCVYVVATCVVQWHVMSL